MRTPYNGSVPVAGLPAFLRLTDIDFAKCPYNEKGSRGEGRTFRPGSNPSHKDSPPMTQADSVLSTPPTNRPYLKAILWTDRGDVSSLLPPSQASLVLAVLPPPRWRRWEHQRRLFREGSDELSSVHERQPDHDVRGYPRCIGG